MADNTLFKTNEFSHEGACTRTTAEIRTVWWEDVELLMNAGYAFGQ